MAQPLRLEALLRRPAPWLGLVACAFLGGQFLVMDPTRFYAWDESIYMAEVSPHVNAIGMFAHRARGVTLLAAPILQVTASIAVVRSYMAILSAIALVVSFLPWTRLYGWVGPVAAALFAGSWLTLGLGSEVMPNLHSAFAVMAALGSTLLFLDRPKKSLLIGVGAAIFLAALLRPLDGAVAFLLVCGIVILRRQQVVALLAASSAGAVAAAIPWLVEAELRFGGAFRRLDLIREVVGGGLTNNVSEYLQLLAGPLRSGVQAASEVSVGIWLSIMLVLAAAALAFGWEGRLAPSVALAASASFAMPYVFFTQAAAPRFMLPAFAFLCLGVAMCLIRLFLADRHVLAAAASVAVLGCLVLNLQIANRWSTAQTEVRGIYQTLGTFVDEIADQSCFVLSQHGYPQVIVGSSCRGGLLASDPASNQAVFAREQAAGRSVHALLLGNAPGEILGRGWSCSPVPPLADTLWRHCTPSGDG